MAGQCGSVGTADGSVTTALFNGPKALTVTSSLDIFVADGCRVRRIDKDGLTSTLAGTDCGPGYGWGTSNFFFFSFSFYLSFFSC